MTSNSAKVTNLIWNPVLGGDGSLKLLAIAFDPDVKDSGSPLKRSMPFRVYFGLD
jgi:hypothetical protein